MVAFGSLIGTAALFAGYASALPRPEWASSDASAAMSSDVTATAAAWGAASSSADSWGSTETAAATAASSWGSSSEGSMGSKGKGSSGSSWSSSADSSMSTDASSWGSSGSSGSSWGSGSSYGSDSVSSADSMSTDAVYATAAASATSYAWSYAATATAAATSSISYGSGSSNWGGSGYENCVQQCMATFGAPSATITAAATSTSSYSDSSSGSSGSGTTHTVIVAPTQGVLRFVPFAVNATPGDTIFYMWNANNHTVTKGSELEICNETSEAPFATGEHDKGFTFTETVNDTNPVFFFCSTPTHCEKGMFGIINPPSVSNNVNTSAASIMPAMMANSSSLSAMYAASNISSNSQAASWGSSMDIGNMPSWSQSYAAENIMYTRAFLAANPSVLKADGSIDMSATNGTWNLPQDISAAVSSNSTSSSASASSTSSSAAAASSSTTKSNGARANAASGALVGIAAVAAAFLAL